MKQKTSPVSWNICPEPDYMNSIHQYLLSVEKQMIRKYCGTEKISQINIDSWLEHLDMTLDEYTSEFGVTISELCDE